MRCGGSKPSSLNKSFSPPIDRILGMAMPYGEEARTDEEGDAEEEEECVESGRMRGFADIDNGSSDKQLTINMQWLKNGDIRASVSRLCGGIIVVLFSDFVLTMVDASSGKIVKRHKVSQTAETLATHQNRGQMQGYFKPTCYCLPKQ